MKRKLFFILMMLFLTSCREEIIPPNNPSGNINQPVKEVTLNSYTLVLNAGNITYNLYDYVRFDNSRAQVYLSILDYSSGTVDVSLLGKSKKVIFSKMIDTGINGEIARLNNEVPDAVIMNFKNFTGKFKVTISRY
jgi:hypothetical protein